MLSEEITDPVLIHRLAALPPDGILRFTLLGGMVRGALASGTAMACRMRANHRLGIIESLALSQAYLCAALSSVSAKDGDRTAIRMDCSGALRGFSVEATWDGKVRGYLFNDSIRIDRPLDSFDLTPFLGSGTLSVSRFQAEGEPFSGHVAMVEGGIAKNMAEYYLRSEQTRTAISVGVKFDAEGRIAGAGGLFLQALPGAADSDMEDAEDRIAELPSMGDWYSRGGSSGEFLSRWFGAFEPDVMATGPLRFECPCSRERFASFVARLPKHELEAMIDPAEVVCHNCGSAYHFSLDELKGFAADR